MNRFRLIILAMILVILAQLVRLLGVVLYLLQ